MIDTTITRAQGFEKVSKKCNYDFYRVDQVFMCAVHIDCDWSQYGPQIVFVNACPFRHDRPTSMLQMTPPALGNSFFCPKPLQQLMARPLFCFCLINSQSQGPRINECKMRCECCKRRDWSQLGLGEGSGRNRRENRIPDVMRRKVAWSCVCRPIKTGCITGEMQLKLGAYLTPRRSGKTGKDLHFRIFWHTTLNKSWEWPLSSLWRNKVLWPLMSDE